MDLKEPVEIKVTLAGDLTNALGVLGLGSGSGRSIWFLEDLTPGLASPTPLLAAGVILRLRSDEGDSDDATVKLRPCRRSQLVNGWTSKRAEDEFEYKIEYDWAGSRRALAASCVLGLPLGSVSAAVGALDESAFDEAAVFGNLSLDFLAACAELRISFAGLVALGPVDATRWKNVELDRFEVDMERWVTGDLDFLELSIRVKPGQADPEEEQSDFEKTLRHAGLTFDDAQSTKTSQVLEQLAKARGRA